jgi:hypothetical protein
MKRHLPEFFRLLCNNCTSSHVVSPLEPYPVQLLPQDSSLGHKQRAVCERPYFISFECLWLPTKTCYDHHPDGFWDFPQRAGWILDGQRAHRKFPRPLSDLLQPVLTELDEKYKCRQTTISPALIASRPRDALSIKLFRSDGSEASLSEEAAFLQAWLFFGVLEQINMIIGLQNDPTSDFLVKPYAQQSTNTLSTATLNTLPQRWTAALEAFSEADRILRWKELLEVVQHVMTLQTVISTVKSELRESRKLTYEECKVMLSIRILFRAILLTLSLSVPDITALQLLMDPMLAQSFPMNYDELKVFASNEMRACGWCISECQLLENFDGAYNFFAARLSLGRWQMNHEKCSDWMCVADQVNEAVYKTVHVKEECQCAMVQVNPAELCAVLDRGKIPKIVVSKDLEVTVTDSEQYVAVSHVCKYYLCLFADQIYGLILRPRGSRARQSEK